MWPGRRSADRGQDVRKDLRVTRFPVRVASLVRAGDPLSLGDPCQLASEQREEVQ